MTTASTVRITHTCTQWLFLRAIGVIYLIAFLSLWIQIDGLIGSHGITPAKAYMAELSEVPGASFWQLPTLVWFNQSDLFLHCLCAAGTIAAIGVIACVAVGPLLVITWLTYLSLVNVGQEFLLFQWDSLLLEAGFLAIFWAPWRVLCPPWKTNLTLVSEPETFTAVLWLLRWLLFRLMFLSGAVKLLSGDPTWRNFTSLTFHYETQPLPTPLAWLFDQLPAWFQSVSVAGVFFIELIVPFLIFVPGRPRIFAAAMLMALQILILLTGNYTFFNWLTLALCLTLFDDRITVKLVPARWRDKLIGQQTTEPIRPMWRMHVRRTAVGLVTALVVLASLGELSEEFVGPDSIALTARRMLNSVQAFHVVNTYGLFAVMTTSRPEIIIEGSNDAVTWLPYTFYFKPGPLDRPPPVVAPYQPRLDWQMWFAALSGRVSSPWFVSFAKCLLQGSPPVVRLLESDPFHGKPPKYVHALLYDYQFTTFDELLRTHNWWKRRQIGVFLPAISLDDFERR